MGLTDERLYYEDSYCTEFEATVVGEWEQAGKWLVQLDCSAFYPTSGGQPHDTGWLAQSRVLDVYVEGGVVLHVVDKPLGEGQLVRGRIDWARRFDHMQQHTGQHILSACFEQLFNADTVGFHLGEEIVTVDLDIDVSELDDSMAKRAEHKANEVVFGDLPIQARFVDDDELARLPLRRAPKVERDVRIVSIGDFDHNACGGTHPKRTGEVGIIKILRRERMRRGIRLTFACGSRALRDYDSRLEVLRNLGAQLSTGDRELAEAVQKIQQSMSGFRKSAEQWQTKWLQLWARDLLNEAEDSLASGGLSSTETAGLPGKENLVVCTILEDVVQPSDLKQALNAVSEEWQATSVKGAAMAVIGRIDNRVYLQATVVGAATYDANRAVRGVLEQLNGKGGGSQVSAQGSCPAQAGVSLTSIQELLRAAFISQLRG